MAAKKRKIEDLSNADLADIDVIVEGEGGVVLRGSQIEPAARIPTGILPVDQILGGGIPRGKMTELSGPEGSCKTAVLLATIAQAQKAGGNALYVDAEDTFDPEWSEKNGIDLDRLRVIKPSSGENAYGIILKYLKTGKMDIIGVDSVAQLVPEAELAGDIADATIGLAARLNAKAMRVLTDVLTKGNHRTAVVFINQRRSNIAPGGMGPQYTTTGGNSIPFYMSVRAQMRRIGWVRKGEEVVGGEFQMELVKAKVSGMFAKASASFRVDFEHGLDYAYDLLVALQEKGVIQKGGAWYTMPDGTKIQGEDGVKELIRGDIDAWTSLLAS